MKTTKTIVLLFLIGFSIKAQETIANNSQVSLNTSYWQFSPRVGYDVVPFYHENFEYIGYEGGLELGLSVNKYWQNWGIQMDFDYISNDPVLDGGLSSPVWVFENGIATQENLIVGKKKINRWALVVGPAYKLERPKFTWENALMLGIGKVKNGEFLAVADTDPTGTVNDQLITYHSGFRNQIAFTGKFQTRFNYFFNNSFGIHFGAYYMHHFNVAESKDNAIIDEYYILNTNLYYAVGQTQNVDIENATVNAFTNEINYRGDNENRGCCGRDISSIGVFAGITFQIGMSKDNSECPSGDCIQCTVCGNTHQPPACCATCGCDVSIVAKDKFTGEVLDDTDVVLINSAGNAIRTGTTNSMGLVVFNNVPPSDYTVQGMLYKVNLEEDMISQAEFDVCKANGGGVINKELIYADENFILEGRVIECNSTTNIPGVNIKLRNKIGNEIKNTVTDANGAFRYHLKQASSYEITGEKDGYYSVTPLEVNTDDFDRNNTLKIDFEMCIDPCGKAVKLDNIQFNTAKWDILPAAYPDLRKVLQIMQLNPNVKIIMSSHTDSRGSDAYNLDLSQKRANSTVEWLVNNGADRSRLVAEGKGETEPIVQGCGNGSNCTDEQHRPNRRTEFKVECN